MGFSHEATEHHFRLDARGGTIEVSTKNPQDVTTRAQIRMHLSHIVKMFAAGDFDVPMFIHDRTPPGSETMTKLKAQIRYQLKETPQGAKVEIRTDNNEALNAIHEFLRFQIADHQTGDTPESK